MVAYEGVLMMKMWNSTNLPVDFQAQRDITIHPPLEKTSLVSAARSLHMLLEDTRSIYKLSV
jgi:hypothetical protein